MSDCFRRERRRDERMRRRGSVAACAVLLVAHQFLPAAAAGGDLICYGRADFNCDWVVDGQDLSYVLGSWGTSSNAIDLDGNCTIDGGDLAIVLGSWGALPEMSDFVPFTFDNESVSLCLGGDSINAVLDGELFPDPYSGGYFGEITVELESSVHVSIQYTGDQTTVMTGTSEMLIDGSDPASTLYL
ncbi:MAG: hypothetical protein MK100_09890, partial [Phycisphaerales bacterium]|nr:hypothetical protein [Phycisphaerales bacterium]